MRISSNNSLTTQIVTSNASESFAVVLEKPSSPMHPTSTSKVYILILSTKCQTMKNLCLETTPELRIPIDEQKKILIWMAPFVS